MGLFRRRRDEGPPPEWAAPLDAEQYAAFRRALATVLGRGHELHDGYVTIPGRESQYGLGNLVQQWALAGNDADVALVEDHFATTIRAEDSPSLQGDALRSAIRAQLWHHERATMHDLELVSRPFADDLVAVVVVDGEDSVRNLHPDDAKAAGLEGDALWDLALAQIDDGQPVDTSDVGEGVQGTFGDSFFVASRLLAYTSAAEHGALVAVPHRHALLTYEISNLDAVKALNLMQQGVPAMFEQGPGSLVPHTYWWRPSGLTLIPVRRDGRDLVIEPPPEFVDMLNSLDE